MEYHVSPFPLPFIFLSDRPSHSKSFFLPFFYVHNITHDEPTFHPLNAYLVAARPRDVPVVAVVGEWGNMRKGSGGWMRHDKGGGKKTNQTHIR